MSKNGVKKMINKPNNITRIRAQLTRRTIGPVRDFVHGFLIERTRV